MLVDKEQHFVDSKLHIFNVFSFDITGNSLAVVTVKIEHVIEMSNFLGFEILERGENHVFITPAIFK
ncbi:hypothetical protein D3C79_919650 [compost metagenome]